MDVISLRWPTGKVELVVGNINQRSQMTVVRTKKIEHSLLSLLTDSKTSQNVNTQTTPHCVQACHVFYCLLFSSISSICNKYNEQQTRNIGSSNNAEMKNFVLDTGILDNECLLSASRLWLAVIKNQQTN